MRRAVELVREHGSVAEAARASGIARPTLSARWHRACRLGMAGGTMGQIPPGQAITGTSTLYDGEGEVRAQWLKTSTVRNETRLLEAIEAAFDRFKGFSVLPPKAEDTDYHLLTVYPRPDLHLGLYAWGQESGEDFDLNLAEETYKRAAADLVSCSPPSETALILALGDTLHGDDHQNQTRRSGHALDVDTRYDKVLESAIWLEVSNIQLALQRHSRVVYKCMKGNHDEVSAVAIAHAVHMFFHNDKRVDVDRNPSLHWYYRHGQCLIGAHHGHRTKIDQAAVLMANHRREDWGQCQHRYYFLGHLHHTHVKEIGGVMVEQLPSPAAKDAYSAGSGYLGQRAMRSITLHRERGERTRTTHVI